MLPLSEIRQYISGLGIAEDSNVYIGKLLDRSDVYVLECRKGNGTSKFKIDEIEMLLDITGMTFEECFAKRKAPEDAATSIKG